MPLSRCNRNYHRMKIHQRGTLASGMLETYYKNNPPFTAPVMPKADFKKLVNDYNSRYADFANGGRAQKADWLIARDTLIHGLDLIADNVDEVAGGNEDIILEGGFQPRKTFRSGKNTPPVPEIESLEHGATGQLFATCKLLEPNTFYGCIISEGAPLDERVVMRAGKLVIPKGLTTAIQIDETKKRKKSFVNLTPMVTYYFYFFARNSAGVSSLSEPRAIICL